MTSTYGSENCAGQVAVDAGVPTVSDTVAEAVPPRPSLTVYEKRRCRCSRVTGV